jgi:hypothetical protein
MGALSTCSISWHDAWMIKKYIDTHTCSRKFRVDDSAVNLLHGSIWKVS